jgi:hypothetical protein
MHPDGHLRSGSGNLRRPERINVLAHRRVSQRQRCVGAEGAANSPQGDAPSSGEPYRQHCS